MKNINLYLLRHGETEWNLANRMQGSKDSPLTEKGISTAKLTGQFLSETPFIAAYSSTQQRAIETRDHILSQRVGSPRIPTAEHAGLCEMDFGAWEGCNIDTLKRDPAFQEYLHFPAKFNPQLNQGEHYLDVILRMQQAIRDILDNETAGNILVVTHGTALRLLLHAVKGESWQSHRNESISPRIMNASISIVNYRQNDLHAMGEFRLTHYNDTAHLIASKLY